MVARRLIAVLILMLVLSSIAAALLPAPRSDSPVPTTTTTREVPPPKPGGRLVQATLDAGARRPRTIELRVGDQLALRVRSPRPDQVDLRGFGQISAVDRFSPATFDLLATRPGTHRVRLIQARRTIGTIVVRPRKGSNERPGK